MADEFDAAYDLTYNTSSCFCDNSNYYKAEDIQRDIDYFTAEYRKYQLE
jgi:hypothetical protein